MKHYIQIDLPDGVHWFERIVIRKMGDQQVPFNEFTPYFHKAKEYDSEADATAQMALLSAPGAYVVNTYTHKGKQTAVVYHYKEYMYMAREMRMKELKVGDSVSLSMRGQLRKIRKEDDTHFYLQANNGDMAKDITIGKKSSQIVLQVYPETAMLSERGMRR